MQVQLALCTILVQHANKTGCGRMSKGDKVKSMPNASDSVVDRLMNVHDLQDVCQRLPLCRRAIVLTYRALRGRRFSCNHTIGHCVQFWPLRLVCWEVGLFPCLLGCLEERGDD